MIGMRLSCSLFNYEFTVCASSSSSTLRILYSQNPQADMTPSFASSASSVVFPCRAVFFSVEQFIEDHSFSSYFFMLRYRMMA